MGYSIALYPFFTSGYLLSGFGSGSAGDSLKDAFSALVTIIPNPWIIHPENKDNIEPNMPTIHAIMNIE